MPGPLRIADDQKAFFTALPYSPMSSCETMSTTQILPPSLLD
ncbi:MAG: hypothetical protein AVDCRST_MAG89-3531 [uncultured Gemmatimonadetes bacterium]|uniref:Uncharacterized protein n=1 Tax=uncultured Gemmatimonadota bacterium TaxID=203437 RepID=A0A6J4MEL7_9BACT|nr:MAG: hypothetical protein AVDCRST_MAG89-3531 [uncultured Gemmatimonadota bacterium]